MSGRVSRINEDHSTDVGAALTCLMDSLADSFTVHAPAFVLLQVIGQESAAIELNGSRVERVLGNGYQDGIIFVTDGGVEDVANGYGGTVSKEDVVSVGRVSIATLNEVGDFLTDGCCTSGVGVCTNSATELGVDLLRAGNGVSGEHLAHKGVVEEERSRDKGEDLTVEGDGLLTKLLRVTDCI